eukprot:scaffold37874_cov31-Tisochrysis_lutea.AAC.3
MSTSSWSSPASPLATRANQVGTGSGPAGAVASLSPSRTPVAASSRLSAFTFSSVKDVRARMKASTVHIVENAELICSRVGCNSWQICTWPASLAMA